MFDTVCMRLKSLAGHLIFTFRLCFPFGISIATILKQIFSCFCKYFFSTSCAIINHQSLHTKYKQTSENMSLDTLNNKDLLTECEVCTGKYCLRFSYRPSDRGGLCDKNQRQYFPLQTEQTWLIRDLLYGFVGLQFVLTL